MAFQTFLNFLEANPANNHSSRVIRDGDVPLRPYDADIVPMMLEFDQTAVGEESPMKIVTVFNKGFRPLPISSVTGVGDFLVTTDCPSLLAPGSTCTVAAIFKPLREGPASGGIYVDTGDAAGVEFVHLLGLGGTGPTEGWDHTADVDSLLNGLWGFIQRAVGPAPTEDGPSISLPSTSVTFPVTETGTESGLVEFVITNTGNANLIIDNIAVSGDFELVP